MQVVRVSIAGASFAEVVSLIGPHHDLVSSITKGDDEWTVTFRQCASIEFIVNGLLERAATEFGLVATGKVTADQARDAAIRFLSMPYTARWHMIDTLDIDVEVDRNNNSHQQSIIWLGRVRDANKIRELIRLLDEKEGDR